MLSISGMATADLGGPRAGPPLPLTEERRGRGAELPKPGPGRGRRPLEAGSRVHSSPWWLRADPLRAPGPLRRPTTRAPSPASPTLPSPTEVATLFPETVRETLAAFLDWPGRALGPSPLHVPQQRAWSSLNRNH